MKNIQYCAKVTQVNFDEFRGFSWLFEKISLQTKFPRLSANFQGTYCFIPPELSNDNSQWTLTSQIFRGKVRFFRLLAAKIRKKIRSGCYVF